MIGFEQVNFVLYSCCMNMNIIIISEVVDVVGNGAVYCFYIYNQFFLLLFFLTFYYTTETTSWVSNAAALHCAAQLSKAVFNISDIHYYRFSYKNRMFSNLCSVFLFCLHIILE